MRMQTALEYRKRALSARKRKVGNLDLTLGISLITVTL